jgi:hypothetical protein
MGADLIGWRDCPLQRPLGPRGFLGKLKMRTYLRVIETQVPPEQRETVKVTVVVNDRDRQLGYPEIREQAETFQRGIPECAQCPLSRGEQLGCYHFITYPVDAAFEEVAFAFFVSQVAVKDSIQDQIYRDIVSKQPAQSSDWHTRRGPQGALAQRPQPLLHTWGGIFGKKKVDSAQLLASLFVPLESPAIVVGYARLFRELVQYVDAQLAAEMKQRGIKLGDDGQIALEVTPQQNGDPGVLAAKMGADVAALRRYTEGTIEEVRKAAYVINVAAAHYADGWKVIVDA